MAELTDAPLVPGRVMAELTDLLESALDFDFTFPKNVLGSLVSPREVPAAEDPRGQKLSLALQNREWHQAFEAVLAGELSNAPHPKTGDLALHTALKMRAPEELSLAILAVHPGAARVPNRAGSLPLHLALAPGGGDGAGMGVIQVRVNKRTCIICLMECKELLTVKLSLVSDSSGPDPPGPPQGVS
jgi:hypothetical protein